jgi:stage IV sporulation protein FB
MFGQVAPTEFDLRFSIFGIPVRVHPLFWLVAALMGSRTLSDPGLGPPYLFVWIGCLFFSILIHELGHALTAKYFGWPPEIMLYFMGGVAMFRPGVGFTASRSILISFAGPAAGFMLYGCVVVFEQYLVRSNQFPGLVVVFAIIQLKWINLWWGLINLLPVLPLDGGRICESVCTSLRPRDGELWALRIAMIVSGGAAFLFLSLEKMYPGFLFGYLCFNNFQMHQAYRGRGSW